MKISVLMSNYNTEESILRECIDSVLSQTLGDFEFIIIDDASTNNSVKVIESYSDKRIKLTKNKERIGLTKNLNVGLDLASGEYIARMDADDICMSNRFEIQYKFMKSHTNYIACGSDVLVFGDRNYITGVKNMPLEARRCSLIYTNNCVPHPTLFMDRQKLVKFGIRYNEKYVTAQDFGLWQVLTRYGDIYGFRKVLVKYRVHDGQLSDIKDPTQKNCYIQGRKDNLEELGVVLDDKELEQFIGFANYKLIDKDITKKVINRIYNANKQKRIYEEKYLEYELNYVWLKTTSKLRELPFGKFFKTLIYFVNREYLSRLDLWL